MTGLVKLPSPFADSAGQALYFYPKNEKADLTPTQAKILRRLVQEEFG